jgi:hypothetical protein
MSVAAKRETFISCAELFYQFAERCFDAEKALRNTMRQVDEPYLQGLELVARAQHALGEELEKHAEKGPENLVSTRLQYTLDRQSEPESDSAGAALQAVTSVNDELQQALHDVEEKMPPESIREMFDALRREVDSVNRQISMIRLSMQDV